jgi:hypothetical protein
VGLEICSLTSVIIYLQKVRHSSNMSHWFMLFIYKAESCVWFVPDKQWTSLSEEVVPCVVLASKVYISDKTSSSCVSNISQEYSLGKLVIYNVVISTHSLKLIETLKGGVGNLLINICYNLPAKSSTLFKYEPLIYVIYL